MYANNYVLEYLAKNRVEQYRTEAKGQKLVKQLMSWHKQGRFLSHIRDIQTQYELSLSARYDLPH